MKIKSIKKLTDLKNKKVLLRTDFNVPLKDGKVLDNFKLEKTLPTIRFLRRYGAKIIIISHLGRPNGIKRKDLSLKQVKPELEKLLGFEIDFFNKTIGLETQNKIARMNQKDVLLLENLRFYKEEKENDKNFAKELAELADIYVNDAFGSSHRAHSSTSAIKKILPSYAGLLLEEEVKNLSYVFNSPKPLILILGGVKSKTKIPLIKNFKKKADKIILTGALGNAFLKAEGLEVGLSNYDDEGFEFARKYRGKNIILPTDATVLNKKTGKIKIKNIKTIAKEEAIFDIGPETIKYFSEYLKSAKTLIWNGSPGKFEDENFRQGSLDLAKLIAKARAFSVCGGGETGEVLHMAKVFSQINWVSTGGGAMLAFLGGKKMPGLEKIITL